MQVLPTFESPNTKTLYVAAKSNAMFAAVFSGGFELLLGRQQSRRPGVALGGRAAPEGDGGSIRGLRFSPLVAGVKGVLTIV